MKARDTGTLQSADGLELYYQRWGPEREPRASIAIQHGLGGHI
jgi:alpha-beta hydrolase superfamily lysophospholipase